MEHRTEEIVAQAVSTPESISTEFDMAKRLMAAVASKQIGEVVCALGSLLSFVERHPHADMSVLAPYCDADYLRTYSQRHQALTQSEFDRARAEAEYINSLPTPEALMKEASEADQKLEVFGYVLWRERGGWSLTNAYGIDNCRFLSSVADFRRLIDDERAGCDIGPIPSYCDEPDNQDDPFTDMWLEALDHASEALLAKHGILDQSTETHH